LKWTGIVQREPFAFTKTILDSFGPRASNTTILVYWPSVKTLSSSDGSIGQTTSLSWKFTGEEINEAFSAKE
jgi:hypothetical protein